MTIRIGKKDMTWHGLFSVESHFIPSRAHTETSPFDIQVDVKRQKNCFSSRHKLPTSTHNREIGSFLVKKAKRVSAAPRRHFNSPASKIALVFRACTARVRYARYAALIDAVVGSEVEGIINVANAYPTYKAELDDVAGGTGRIKGGRWGDS